MKSFAIPQRARPWLLATLVVLVPAYAFADGARSTPRHAARTVWDSVFTAAQAQRGDSTYARTCARCHQAGLGGADEAPALAGSTFLGNWNGQTLYELHTRVVKTMPTDTPGTYRRQDVADVIAYMLQFNGFPAGSTELSTDDELLKSIQFVTTKP